MARVTPDEYAEKWGRRLKSATQDIRKGIQRVSVAPGIKAAQSVNLLRLKLLAAIDDGTWANAVKAVSLQDWQTAAGGKGVDRISAGVDGAMTKQVGMAQKLLTAVDASVADANKTPRGTLQDNIARMVAFVNGMASRKLRRPGA
jgi:hypothetical protein